MADEREDTDEPDRRAAQVVAVLEDRYARQAGFGHMDAADLGPVMKPGCERRMFDRIGLAIADRYALKTWDYAFCDAAANCLFGLMIDRINPEVDDGTPELAERMYAVFLAFDAGEYQLPSYSAELDPIIAFTDPQIAKIRSENQTQRTV